MKQSIVRSVPELWNELQFTTSSESSLWQEIASILERQNHEESNENANVDGHSPMGQMARLAAEVSKQYMVRHLLSPAVRHAVDNNYLYIHDADFMAVGTTTCCQIPLGKLLAQGFNTGHGYMRPPQDIRSALALASIILQANQNMQHGGQAFPMFDYDLAPYIRRTFDRHCRRLETEGMGGTEQERIAKAWTATERDTYQACEAFVHNSNSMHSRGGGQVPFISVNYGTDTSKEGRLLIRSLLLATKAGLGRGETPIFPIQVFKVKQGVNVSASDPNYDLYRLAIETTCERLFPNFSFLDAPFNAVYDDGQPENEVTYMGCRTRIMGNIHGNPSSIGRGNLSFTSINLVKLALMSRSESLFFQLLDEYLELAITQLIDRYKYQGKKLVRHFRFLYRQGVWFDGEKLAEDDTLDEVLKHGSLSVGFIGLAEALVALTGKHHGECNYAQLLGLRIITRMREAMNQATLRHQLNFTLLATPAEGLSGKFVKKDRDEFGSIPGITDRDYYTNSFHVPVYARVLAIDKIRIEAPYHELCNAGHITYIECDGSLRHNPDAVHELVQAMRVAGIGYGSINHPIDRCKVCGYSSTIEHECPQCGTSDQRQIERIRRITGYLVGDMSRWNAAKSAEEKERVKHR